MRQIIGYILIGLTTGVFAYYFKWSKKEESTMELGGKQKITVLVKGNYSPNIIKAKLGEPLTIIFDRQEDSSCSKRVIIEGFNISEELPDFGTKEITITPQKEGKFTFSCEMGMYQGTLIIEK